MENYFKVAGDLDNNLENNVENEYFNIAGDLETLDELVDENGVEVLDTNDLFLNNDSYGNNQMLNKESFGTLNDDIKIYLNNIVSGIKYPDECELGNLCGEGNAIISFKELQDMIDSGEYNIISANYFNPEMIEVKYQQFSKEKKMLF